MKHRLVDYLLLFAAIVGGILALKTGLERLRLRREYERLAQFVSELSITDPDQVHLLALQTKEPLHFAWRIYTPAKYQFVVRDRFGSSSSSYRAESQESIVRIRFREHQGYLEVHTQFPGSSGRMSVGDPALIKLLHDRWDRIQVEQLGAKEQVSLPRDKRVMLLRLTLPQEILEEAKKNVDRATLERYVPALFEMELTPP